MIKKAVEIAFLVLIFSLAFMQPDIESFGPAITLTEPIFLVTAGLFVIALAARQVRFRFDHIYIFFALYAAGLLLSAIFSVDPRFSFFRFIGELYLLALAVVTINIVRSREVIKRVVLVWLAASGASALVGTLAVLFFYLGVSNFITDIAFHYYGSLPPGNYTRIQGTFLYPSMLCNYLTVSFMMLLAANRLGWIARPVYVLLLVIFSITALFTLTPGLGGLMLAVAMWIWLTSKEQGRLAFAKLSLIGGVIAAAAFQAASAFSIIPTATSPYHFEIGGMRIDPTQRLLAWSQSIGMFLSHPILGKGVGLNVVEVSFLPPQGQMRMITDAHNMLLSVAAQSGLCGAVPFVLICVAVVRRSLPFTLTAGNTLRTALGIAFISAFLVQGLVGSFEDARHLWVLIGLVIACGDLPKLESDAGATTTSP